MNPRAFSIVTGLLISVAAMLYLLLPAGAQIVRPISGGVITDDVILAEPQRTVDSILREKWIRAVVLDSAGNSALLALTSSAEAGDYIENRYRAFLIRYDRSA